jgi:CBS domain containing-hemolysin-like protein
MTDVPVGLLLVVAAIGILLAAALSAGEVAVRRVTRAAVSELVADRRPSAMRVRRLVEHPARTAASAAFVRLVAEMVASTCLTLVIASLLPYWWLVLLVAAFVCALVALLIVRLSPRSIGRGRPVTVLSVLSRLLLAVVAVTAPTRRLVPIAPQDGEIDEDELREMVQRVSEAEGIAGDERMLFRSVLELGDTLTREVMVPRTDMVTTTADAPLRSALELLLRSGYSRVPVIGESVDDMRGVLYLKDVARRVHTTPGAMDEPAAAIARPAVFVPESKPVDELLRELQMGSSHLAIVVDEYGGVAGLVTIEDALEEIVGELTDEHDRGPVQIEDLGAGEFRVPARLSRDDLGELFGLDVDDDDVDTAGGLLAKALGKVPLPGTSGDIHGLHLIAEHAEGRRKQVSTLLVRLSGPRDPDTSQELIALENTDDEQHGAH